MKVLAFDQQGKKINRRADDTTSLPDNFYDRDCIQVAAHFDVVSETGLRKNEAERRLLIYGLNRFDEKCTYSIWRLLREQFSSIIVLLLAFAAAVAFFTGNILEGAAILVVLLINAAIGFGIEWKAGRTLDALRQAIHTTSRVRRSNVEFIIDAENLVPGDIIILSTGDCVPADSRIIKVSKLRTDESTLTGESLPVEKSAEKVSADTPLAERSSMVYFGTTIVAGNAEAIVTATGTQTEIGRIGKLVAKTTEEKTPLEKKLEELGKKLVYIVIGIAAIVFTTGYFRGENLWLMLEVSVSLAVAAVPEGLPAVTTLILALGVLKMARRNALVRKLSAVESLGSTTVICTDKTGTLTENKMTVSEYRLAHGDIVSLSEPNNEKFFLDQSGLTADPNLLRLLRVSILCNEARMNFGDPTETALLEAFEKFGFDLEGDQNSYEKIIEHPFDSETKKMITVVREKDSGKLSAELKGAPGVVLKSCSRIINREGIIVPIENDERSRLIDINEKMAARALRVLALAEKDLAADFTLGKELENDYIFLGFVGITDPPRSGVREAIEKAQSAGIRVVMLTGDQINTARAVAEELALCGNAEIFALHSRELNNIDENGLANLARQAHVFARVTPEDKLRIVRALQKSGEIVAVTGDGVNDAPALKQSDIGIAMGKRGTEVAKEVSDIVLTDDNFATIVKAIESGRGIYANIIKVVHLLFSDNLGEILVIFTLILAGLPLPLLPLQILWINLVTDVFPALSLAVEPSSPETMHQPPHQPEEALLSREFMFLIFWKGLISSAIVIITYLWALQFYGEGRHARSIALFSMIGVQTANLFNCRSRSRSTFSRFFSNPYIFGAVGITILLQTLAMYFPPLARILDVEKLNLIDYLAISLSIILPLFVVELTKLLRRKKMSID